MDDCKSDVLIFGAGISGLSAAYFLAKAGYSVRILDSYAHLGGNHMSRNVGPYTFDIGAIFFWSDNPQFRMFDGLLQTCVPIDFSISKVSPTGAITRYPFSVRDEILNRDPLALAAVAGSLAKARLSRAKIRSAADFARFHMGALLYEETGLRTYLDRFYGLSGEEVSVAFAERRMTWIRNYGSASYWFARSVGAVKARLAGNAAPPLQCYARPREGFDRYYGRIGECLAGMGVDIRLSAPIRGIEASGGVPLVHTDAGSFVGRRVISTMPVAMTAGWAGFPVNGNLASLNLTTLFCSYEGPAPFKGTVLYNFHPDGIWKRLTMHSGYYGLVDGRSYFAVECTHLADDLTAGCLFEDFAGHVRRLGIFGGDLRLEGSMVLAHAYPVYRHGFDQVLHPLINELEERGIEQLGRQGRFDYIPSTTMAIQLVRDALGT